MYMLALEVHYIAIYIFLFEITGFYYASLMPTFYMLFLYTPSLIKCVKLFIVLFELLNYFLCSTALL